MLSYAYMVIVKLQNGVFPALLVEEYFWCQSVHYFGLEQAPD
jgi:hypothetical protein